MFLHHNSFLPLRICEFLESDWGVVSSGPQEKRMFITVFINECNDKCIIYKTVMEYWTWKSMCCLRQLWCMLLCSCLTAPSCGLHCTGHTHKQITHFYTCKQIHVLEGVIECDNTLSFTLFTVQLIKDLPYIEVICGVRMKEKLKYISSDNFTDL